MRKKLITIPFILLFLTGCQTLPAEMDQNLQSFYNIQQETAQNLQNLSTQLDQNSSMPEKIAQIASDGDKMVSSALERLQKTTVEEYEEIKTSTRQSLSSVSQLLKSIKAKADELERLNENPDKNASQIDQTKKLLEGYISRVKNSSASLSALKEELIKQVESKDNTEK